MASWRNLRTSGLRGFRGVYGEGYLRVPLKAYYKGIIRFPLKVKSFRAYYKGIIRFPLKVKSFRAYYKGNIRFPLKVKSFRKLGVPYFGVLIVRIRLFGVLY